MSGELMERGLRIHMVWILSLGGGRMFVEWMWRMRRKMKKRKRMMMMMEVGGVVVKDLLRCVDDNSHGRIMTSKTTTTTTTTRKMMVRHRRRLDSTRIYSYIFFLLPYFLLSPFPSPPLHSSTSFSLPLFYYYYCPVVLSYFAALTTCLSTYLHGLFDLIAPSSSFLPPLSPIFPFYFSPIFFLSFRLFLHTSPLFHGLIKQYVCNPWTRSPIEFSFSFFRYSLLTLTLMATFKMYVSAR